jgi:ATP-binding cassette subfamily D (ALD) long-chain fatty acid import protein
LNETWILTSMTIFSKLRPNDASLAHFSATYAAHRPLIQRCLTSGFIIYVLSTTYRGLSARPSRPSSEEEGKVRKGGNGKAPRVAVSSTNLNTSFLSLRYGRILQVDAIFYQRLSTILRIVVPGLRSKEALLLVMHSSLLIFRTAISLYVAALDGK